MKNSNRAIRRYEENQIRCAQKQKKSQRLKRRPRKKQNRSLKIERTRDFKLERRPSRKQRNQKRLVRRYAGNRIRCAPKTEEIEKNDGRKREAMGRSRGLKEELEESGSKVCRKPKSLCPKNERIGVSKREPLEKGVVTQRGTFQKEKTQNCEAQKPECAAVVVGKKNRYFKYITECEEIR